MTTLLVNGIDKSDYITGISSIEYIINKNFTFELPDLSFEAAQDIAEIDDIIRINNLTGSIDFYVTEKTQSKDTLFWHYKCEHILFKLKAIKVNTIPTPSMIENVGANFTQNYNDWCDVNLLFNQPFSVTECYKRYNNFDIPQYSDGPVEETVQQYYQVLFLIQILIRKSTGLSISEIDLSAIYNENSIYHATQPSLAYPYWQHVNLKNYELAIPIQNLKRLNTSDSTQYQTIPTEDIERWDGILDCLDLLSYLCSSLCLIIDIFDGYKLKNISQRSLTEDRTVEFEDNKLIRLRKVSVSENILNLVNNEYNSELYYEYYRSDDHSFNLYSWGGSGSSEREITGLSAGNINNIYFTTETVDVNFPNHFKLYQIQINTNSFYRSRVYNLRSTITMPTVYPPDNRKIYWINCLADFLYDYWESFNRISKVTEISGDLTFSGHVTKIDLENREINFERYDHV
jgi:hypothetical protein